MRPSPSSPPATACVARHDPTARVPGVVDRYGLPQVGVIAYTIDADDQITAVNAAWEAGAATHGMSAMPSIVGTSLWTHVAGPEARYLYGLLFRRVRASGTRLSIPYRCDAPDAARLWHLEIVPANDGALVVRSWIVDECLRGSVALLAADAPRSRALVVMCSWCARIEVDGAFHDIEDAVVRRPILCESPVPTITHGICADCMARVLVTLDGDAAARAAA